MPKPTCRGCGAIVRWVTTKAGEAMICDPERITAWVVEMHPSAKKLTLIDDAGKVETGYEMDIITPGSREIEGYVPHWATCSKAKEFRPGGSLR